MAKIGSFDAVAALSPDLARAIQTGRANPRRWISQNGKLVNSDNGKLLYTEDIPDHELEQQWVSKWLCKAECLQLADSQTLESLINHFGCEWVDLAYKSVNELTLENIHDSADDLQFLWGCEQIKQFLNTQDLKPALQPKHYSGGLLLVYGMGSCEALTRLISTVQPRLVLVFEADIDLIAKQAETGIAPLLKAIDDRGSKLFFITDDEAEKAVIYAKLLIASVSLYAQSYTFSFCFRESSINKTIGNALANNEEYSKTIRNLGFFVDELHMLMNSIITFSHTGARLVSYGTIKEHARHAVVVASGPSLMQSLPLIKKERSRFDLISSFSTLGVLLDANIKPDYHCQMERHADSRFILCRPELKDFAKQAVLLTNANVDPRLSNVYKSTIAFLRSASTSSAFLASSLSDFISAEGTEAANAALAFAVLLGYRTIHLFGVDLGAVDPTVADRASGALAYSDREMNIRVKGNLRDEIWTSQSLKEAAEWMGLFLNPDLYLPSKESLQDLKVLNYSDGQLIPRTISCNPNQFDAHLSGSQQLDCIKLALSQTYSSGKEGNGIARVIGCDLRSRIKLQCSGMKVLMETPLDVRSFELCRHAFCDLQTGELTDQVVTRLFAGTVSRIWIYILIIDRLIPEHSKREWEKVCREILFGCIDSMENLSLAMLEYVLSLPDLSAHRLESVLEKKERLRQV